MFASARIGATIAGLVLVAIVAPALHAATAATDAQPSSYRVFVTNEMSGTLSVIDGGSQRVVATLHLGKRPRGLKASPMGDFLYVALSGSPVIPPGADESKAPPADKAADGIGVVDLKTLRLVRTIRGVSDPEQLALSADGKRLYIASEDTGMLRVIEVGTERVLVTMPVGEEPEGVTISPDGRFIYVTSEEDAQVSVVSTETNRLIKQIKVGARPRFTVFSSNGARAYISGESDASVSVVDTKTLAVVHTLKLAGENVRPMGLVLSPDDKTLFVATGRGGTLTAIDTQTYKIGRAVSVGPRPWNIDISPDGKRIYTANGPSNDISIVDVNEMKVIGKIAVGDRPWGVVVVRAK
ncbi:MAG TPA: beta-propeller fold lactonase family protein [Steroidobacteraceae bacterium]|nr:beta-propeller fold lactonase family protein [Steroidobacteraceae bacterium]